VAQNFIECEREQGFLLPPDIRDWLPENHLVWTVLDAVAEMDLWAFYADYRSDGRGRAAYDPGMMVALLLYAYSRGERSSRGIERECEEDIAYRVIAANQRPDHATIARFICRHEAALAEVFGSVLAVCAKAGLVKVGVIAIDGTKVPVVANEEQTLDYEQIAREILAEAKATDEAEDERFGEARGDELPPQVATHHGRRAWLREAKRELDRERAQNPRPIPRSRPKRLAEAKRQLDEQLAAERRASAAYENFRAHGRMKDGRRLGARPTPYSPPQQPSGQINVTDPDSRLLKAPSGYVRATTPRWSRTEPDRDCRRGQRRLARLRAPRADVRRRRARAGIGRRRREAGRRDRRRRLLAPGADAADRQPRHPGPDPARLVQAQVGAAGMERRPLRAHAPRLTSRARSRALPTTPGDDRAGVRADQVKPRDGPVPKTRQARGSDRMAADHRHAQSPGMKLPGEGSGGGVRARS
jgi:transposase